MSDSLQPHGVYGPWNSPGQNTGVGSLALLQGIFPTQGSNPGLPHFRCILNQLSHKGRSYIYICICLMILYIYIYIHIYIWFDSSITLLTEHQCLPLDYWATLRVLIVLKGGCVQFSLYNWRRAGVWSVHYWQNSLLRHGIAVKIWSHTICLLVLDHCMTL